MKTKLLQLMALGAMMFVPIGLGAQDFGTDDVISSTSVWTFDQFQAKEIIAKSSTVNYSGLYIQGHNDSKPSYASYADRTVSFDAYSIKTFYNYYAEGGKNSIITAAWLSGKTATDIGQDMMAFNVGVAGTTYIAMAGATKDKETRTFDLFFSPLAGGYEDNATYHVSSEATGTNAENIKIISLTNASAGTYFVSASASHYVFAIRFVPTVVSTETKKITMSDMGVMTFSSPQGWSLPSGLKAYTATTSKSNGTLTLTAVPGDIIPPCTGVILQGTHNTEYTLTAADAAQVTPNKNYYFRPVLCDYALTGEFRYDKEDGSVNKWNASRNNYILAKQGGDMVFSLSSGSGNLAAGKAYYSIRPDQVNYAAGARFFTLDFGEGETTGINATLNNNEMTNNVYFNLNGQRVAQPTKGMYIVNGKKVIIK